LIYKREGWTPHQGQDFEVFLTLSSHWKTTQPYLTHSLET
jgi:hypothetical protein